MYGKLIDGELRGAPRPIRTENGDVFTNDPALLLQYGYKPIILTKTPDTTKTYTATWEESDTAITQVWVEVEISDQDEIPADEALRIITAREDSTQI